MARVGHALTSGSEQRKNNAHYPRFTCCCDCTGYCRFFASGLKPPEKIRRATGIGEGGYWQIRELYKAELAKDGTVVKLLETAGSLENVERIASGEADVAIVQGGLALPENANLASLGAIFLEPIAIFRSKVSPLDANPGEWKDIRIAASGPMGSGSRAAALAKIEAAGAISLDPPRPPEDAKVLALRASLACQSGLLVMTKICASWLSH